MVACVCIAISVCRLSHIVLSLSLSLSLTQLDYSIVADNKYHINNNKYVIQYSLNVYDKITSKSVNEDKINTDIEHAAKSKPETTVFYYL